MNPDALPNGSTEGLALVALVGYTAEPGCEVVLIPEEPELQVTDAYHFHGSFIVPRMSGCRQTGITMPTPPGVYSLSISCYACSVGTFEVTNARLAQTGGSAVVFTLVGAALILGGGLIMRIAEGRVRTRR